MARNMAKESTITNQEASTKESGSMTKNMDMGS